MAAARRRDRSARSLAKMVAKAARRPDGSAGYPAKMVGTAFRLRDRSNRSMVKRVWIAAPIMWRRMKTILSHRRRLKVVKLQEVAKQAKQCGLRSCRRMQWSLLPSEIVDTILTWLPGKPLGRFRCVCKEWRSLSYKPNFIKEHHTCARALGRIALVSRRLSSPKILFYDFGDNGEVRNQALNMRFGDQSGCIISNPVSGLICIEYLNSYTCDDGSHYLLNPVTRELAKLPTSRNSPCDKFSSLGLGFDSSTGVYKLVTLFYIKGMVDSCGCKVLELGTQEWREVRGAPCMPPVTEPVLLNGDLNWISVQSNFTGTTMNYSWTKKAMNRTIMAFNLKDENFRMIPVPLECRTGGDYIYLGEWEGLLCLVMLPANMPEFLRGSMAGRRSLVRIWRREDYATCRWREAHCSELPKHACVDGRLSLVGIRGQEMLMVTNREGGLGSICCYDLRTRSLRELYNEHPSGLPFLTDPSCLQFLTESLVSPRYLAGNLSLQ